MVILLFKRLTWSEDELGEVLRMRGGGSTSQKKIMRKRVQKIQYSEALWMGFKRRCGIMDGYYEKSKRGTITVRPEPETVQ